MASILFWIIFTAVLLFGFVLIFGPPYVPTLNKQMTVALDLIDLKPGQTLLELGSGDGRVVRMAAARGLHVVGIELNPLLVIISIIRTWRYRRQVRIIWGDIWRVPWPEADGVFTFLLQRQMAKLDKRIEAWHSKPVCLASFAFYIKDKKPVISRDGIFLYRYHPD